MNEMINIAKLKTYSKPHKVYIPSQYGSFVKKADLGQLLETAHNSDYAKCSRCGTKIDKPMCLKCSFPTFDNTVKDPHFAYSHNVRRNILEDEMEMTVTEYREQKKEQAKQLAKHTKGDLVDKLLFAYDTIKRLETKLKNTSDNSDYPKCSYCDFWRGSNYKKCPDCGQSFT